MTDDSTSSEAFDRWYADLAVSRVKDDLVRRHLGLPPEMLSTSLLPWSGLEAVTTSLRLVPGEVLLDLACGRGGYGLEVASRTRARLLGMDFSVEAVRQATANAAAQDRAATFEVGSLTDTGLPDASVDAVLVVDALQFVDLPERAFAEAARVLDVDGRLVLTAWEARDPDDERVAPGLRGRRWRDGLTVAGFTEVEVEDCPDWAASERALWEEAATLAPGEDRALQELREEALTVLETFDLTRRVMVSATRA
ncbi:class I SAM-dependent methyltransferase [Nocardioides aurantiacus]|uniref:Methyltransferase family protein n=1 Tax=Nocardioides aurantiacus TaxID=86796 RepID=A0A3N2CV01_9ACTN|nr:class I SAM-dependent methyltransferase [Nocardioides aurantiacus]ROR91361.1 methyltransferase family protein [Nocardioides aurantiacus]